ncbi:uncharacterized protein NEMAJ01_0939 [Nematocida major]|uniref:uncharacterized protein n=1 Tax=Nematocida major TaxID=1912982 RepID=UPI002007820F|nr:uncharacterized protein NEMAJ01_0939 [Nematocida major]KAH9386043.1 hypothetical protein NEMAJ01_0939 [Nematocida major]
MGGATSKCVGASLHVIRVTKNSAADRCGVIPVFNYIVGVNGEAVTSEADIIKITQLWEQGSIKLMVYDSRLKSTHPVDMLRQNNEKIGFSIKLHREEMAPVTFRVLDVDYNSPAIESGLRKNEDYIIGHENGTFSNVYEFESILERHRGAALRLLVYNIGRLSIRKVEIVPTAQGEIGCDLGSGILNEVPYTNAKIEIVDEIAPRGAAENGPDTKASAAEEPAKSCAPNLAQSLGKMEISAPAPVGESSAPETSPHIEAEIEEEMRAEIGGQELEHCLEQSLYEDMEAAEPAETESAACSVADAAAKDSALDAAPVVDHIARISNSQHHDIMAEYQLEGAHGPSQNTAYNCKNAGHVASAILVAPESEAQHAHEYLRQPQEHEGGAEYAYAEADPSINPARAYIYQDSGYAQFPDEGEYAYTGSECGGEQACEYVNEADGQLYTHDPALAPESAQLYGEPERQEHMYAAPGQFLYDEAAGQASTYVPPSPGMYNEHAQPGPLANYLTGVQTPQSEHMYQASPSGNPHNKKDGHGKPAKDPFYLQSGDEGYNTDDISQMF